MSHVELTERLLMDAGGWQAAKLARALVESGRVVSAAYTPPVLKGVVREGELELRAGLKISSKSDIENLCPCRQSRQYGAICAHSLAVGYALLLHKTGPGSDLASRNRPPQPSPSQSAAPGSAPHFILADAGGTGPDFVALHVILPPQFLPAWERGNLTVGIEADRSGRRVLLNALSEKETYRCSEADLRLVEAVRALLPGSLSGMLSLSREKGLQLLEGLRGHPRVTFGKSAAVHISSQPVLPKLEVQSDSLGRVTLHVVWAADTRLLIAGQGPAWTLTNSVFAPAAPGLPPAYNELLRRDVMLPPEQAAPFLATELPALRAFFEVTGSAAAAGAAPRMIPEAGTFSLTLEGSLNHLAARLQRIYSKRVVTLGVTSPSENWALPDPADPSHILCRNFEAERLALADLTRFGFTGPDGTGHFVLRGERAILTFFGEGYPALAAQWDVTLGPRFTNVSAEIERITPRVEILSSGEQWFDLQFDLSTGSGERFSAAEVQRMLQLGQNHVRLKSGKLAVFNSALLDDFQSVLRDCNPQQRQPGSYRIDKAHAGYLEAAAAGAGFAVHAGANWRQWAQSQQGKVEMTPLPLGDLETVLRGYQKHGAAWLHFLGANGLGGILADDMGLGKTLQALAYLRTQPGPSLVVCPSSLIFNWQREVEKFTPERKVLVIEGAQRSRKFAEIPKADLVITSYPLLRRDAERYRQFAFSTVILDEAQHIKNPDTQNAQAAGMLRAARKFILTGTPVENSVRDIWSLMNFVMPGYLGERDDFRERYEIPIARQNDKETLARLAKRLRPFLLRRRKQEVAADLPQKLENVAYCELNEAQKQVYAALLQGARAQIDEATGEKNAGRAQMLMLTALLRLRQASCDLRLLDKAGAAAAKADSGKVELFNELLQEAVDGGHRVLVFSQFVSMLTLLRRELEGQGIAYCYLDGQTRDRMEEVDRFQNGDAPVFLISLKAGGVGLNLTAADTVIHFDPWWNPAVEAQATDRAHRIGQKNVVTAYKLIARGTVEEKILHLQRKKREIIDAAIENEEPLMEGLTLEEIRGLLE
ncbi:MAG: SNF2-related protein [Verrucomicrobia bacterium]|nr:SNF2-related protein [Verrucomicrobiota bacterium]